VDQIDQQLKTMLQNMEDENEQLKHQMKMESSRNEFKDQQITDMQKQIKTLEHSVEQFDMQLNQKIN
jgi:septal ring factor EnvC (AmiA/AmiB activator)